MDHLRLVSAEACDLRSVLRAIRSGDAPMSAYADYIDRTRGQMEDLIAPLVGDDAIRHIQNTWEQMQANRLLRDPHAEYDAQEQLQLLGLLDAQCRQIVYWTGLRTVPERLKDWLELSEPGYAIPFHAVFEDEVPDADDRQKILDQLAWSPSFLKAAGGIVDPVSGLVYRYDSRKSGLRQGFSLVYVLGMIALGVAVVWGLQQLPPLDARPLADLEIGWMAVLAGVVVHGVIAMAKGLRSQGALPPGLPINRFLILLNARLGFVLFRVVVALIGYLGLVYAVSGSPLATGFVFNAFLVGYSLDSMVELFGTTLDQRSAAQLANLRKQFGT
ncbi:hypothetical protein [Longimicrobium sp.]|uniref:hypothetical protein n=1 Tax=Longimicrobium sp. TaxID=2029185 RepID=UPI002BB3B604|nr:hypothetical protein [Longimicrobium sp.]HSU13856.1 hypothetical protein [Longimicrobium sp.]